MLGTGERLVNDDLAMPVTLKELAARARVHPSTISRVANHDPNLRIAPPTRQRIEALLRETEYRPNGIARGLKLRQTLVLAVVIPDVTNPFFAALFRGVEDAASPRGYNVLLCNTDGSPARQRSHLQSLHARRVDGVIMASSFLKDPTVRWLRHQGIPACASRAAIGAACRIRMSTMRSTSSRSTTGTRACGSGASDATATIAGSSG